jgi:hypothetical protein
MPEIRHMANCTNNNLSVRTKMVSMSLNAVGEQEQIKISPGKTCSQ